MRVRDGITGEPVCFRLFISADTADNPMQSEVSSHIGGNGNCFCRKCKAGGTTEEKETAEIFETLFHVRCCSFTAHRCSIHDTVSDNRCSLGRLAPKKRL